MHLVENNPWSCLPASFAMALDISFEEMIKRLGHDGDSRPYEDKTKRRGWHFQECIDVAWDLSYCCTPIERYPALTYSTLACDFTPIYFGIADVDNAKRFQKYLSRASRGVLEGIRDANKGHACAWDGSLVFDPSGRVYAFEDSLQNNFRPHTLWILE
jgi:hypothetical protein